MEKPTKHFFPVYRKCGVYSGSPRDLDQEFNVLKEPDPDDPEAWLTDERNDPDFETFVRDRVEYVWRNVDFSKTGYFIGGQSHIDVAWRWRYWQTLRKTIITYKKAVWHVNNHPDYTFVSSQPLLLEWIREVDPVLFGDIKAAVKIGRFDLAGGMYVEPDCHLPSGEAFVRQRILGQWFYLEHFGKLSDVEWVPDSFGFANTLPQIFLKSGSKYFMTTKLCGNSYSTFPFVNFLWESPDGSQIISYLNPGGFGPFTIAKKFDPLRRLLKPGIKFTADYTVDKPEDEDVFSPDIPDIALFMGKGDGGHGPTGQEVAVMDLLTREKGVKWITATKYFQEHLEPHRERLPIWKDELYYEFHRGTITTQDLVKCMNRYFEWRLCTIESLASIAEIASGLDGSRWASEIELAWKFTCLNQFHDVLPGSSIPEVYDDCYDIWEATKGIIDNVEVEAWNALLGGSLLDDREPTHVLLYNGTGYDVNDVLIEMPNPQGLTATVARIGEKHVHIQQVDDGPIDLDPLFVARGRRLLLVGSLPQHGFESLELELGQPLPDPTVNAINSDDNVTLENDLYSLCISKQSGDITSLYYKKIDKELLEPPGISFKVFFDWLPAEQCWNILPGYRTMPVDQAGPSRVQITERGPVRWTVQVERTITNEDSESPENKPSRMIQLISIYNGSPGIGIEFLFDWHTCEATTKLDIHTTTHANEVVSEVPYGTITRSTKPVANHDVPRWENYYHTWLDIPSSDGTWGLAVVNNGKYGYDAKGGRLGLTVLRGPLYPTPSGEAWVNQERANRRNATGEREPSHADIGTHRIPFLLLPHERSWIDSVPFIPSFAHWFNEGCSCIRGIQNELKVPTSKSIVWGGTENVEITCIKRAKDGSGYILRVVESHGKNGDGIIHVSKLLNPTAIFEVDLLERDIPKAFSATRDANGNMSIKFPIKPHEIKNFKLGT